MDYREKERLNKERNRIGAINHYYAKDDEEYYDKMKEYMRECIGSDKITLNSIEDCVEYYIQWIEMYKQVREYWESPD